MKRLRTFLPAILCGSAVMLSPKIHAATFTWQNISGNWSAASSWAGGLVPTGTNPDDILVFGGNVSPAPWVASNDNVNIPFRLNQLVLNGIDSNPLNSNVQHVIQQNALRFGGVDPQIRVDGTANVVINTPVQFSNLLAFGGNSAATITINAGISGVGDIIKTGSSTFRFGTVPAGVGDNPGSSNTWVGNLFLEEGTIRYNNNAQAASSALRANPVHLNGAAFLSAKRDGDDEQDGFETSLRMGTLNGSGGTVFAGVEGNDVSNYDIVITALHTGTYGGTIILQPPTGTGNDGGDFVVRGPGTQTLSGTVQIYKDMISGYGSTTVLTGNATLAKSITEVDIGTITFAGGTVVLDNTFSNGGASGRLRDGSTTSTTVEAVGGGTLRLIGNSAGTVEQTGRLQLGSPTNLRSGHLAIQLVQNSVASGATELVFAGYRRDVAMPHLTTLEFSAVNTVGATRALGTGGVNPRVYLSAPNASIPEGNDLIGSTDNGVNAPLVGWAVVNSGTGWQFAGYDPLNGVVGVQGTPVNDANWAAQPASANVLVSGSFTAPAGSSTLNSVRIRPNAGGGVLTLGSGILSTTAIMLADALDFAIVGAGSIGGNGPRYFQVKQANLTVDVPINGSTFPIVKAGEGTLTLNSASNANLNQVVAINGGAIRATPGSSLPQGELRLRGGQLEIVGGGTFSRNLGYGANSVNWSGVMAGPGGDIPVDEDRGSGGFAAIGADVTIDLGFAGPTNISWEDTGFLRSGYALVFGSRFATNRVTWADNLSLSHANTAEVSYNAREIRVLNNLSTSNDSARISGTISGRLQNDLLKTGTGDLEITGTNTYLGATMVHGGRLLVNDSGNSESSFLHKVMDTATLGGNGRVGNVLIDTGGTLAPGRNTSIASIFRTKDLQFLDGTSILRIDLGGISPGGDGTNGYDQLNVTGTVTLNGADLEGSLLAGFTPTVADIFFLILNDGLDPVVGLFAEGNQITFGGQTFNISYVANFGGTGDLMVGGNDVALQMVPEPSSVALMGLGALALVRRRREAR
jgi:autotransporter-associated beta strand protein